MSSDRRRGGDPPETDAELRVQRLLQEALDLERTPEEVCADDPDVLHEVRERWARIQDMDAQIHLLFPSRNAAFTPEDRSGERLPLIPGYEIDSILGRGGMGVVYRARQLQLGRTVALKMMLAGVYASASELERFRREARAAAGLRSEHIVKVFEVGELEGRLYFTMELVEGGSLAQALGGKPWPVSNAAALLATLARAVAVAHAGGIVHRDLKPSNILLEPDGTPKIADFGLARRLDGGSAITHSGARVGTPGYMAPEQAGGGRGSIGISVDVYALGAILYEMLTGRPPFQADTAAETERQVIHDDPIPPSRWNPKLPRDVETIALKCLDKRPERRYPSAAELAKDVERFLAHEPILARPIGRLERIAKWVRRRPVQASIGVGATLILGGLLGFALWVSGQRATSAHAAGEDLAETDAHVKSAEWAAARTALERARGRLGPNGPVALRERVDEIDRELTLIARLEAIRMDRSMLVRSGLDEGAADVRYGLAFRAAGLGTSSEDPALVAERIRASPVADALVSALDDWALCAPANHQTVWVLDVARLADPDPTWRDYVRDSLAAPDPETLKDLSQAPEAAGQRVSELLLLAYRLRNAGLDRVPFLQRVQFAHPADFWVNFALGEALDEKGDPAAIGSYQAALAIHPDTVAVLANLGTALATQHRADESYEYYERALKLDPDSAVTHLNYAAALDSGEHFDKSAGEAREAIRLDPTLVPAHACLAHALWRRGEYGAAQKAAKNALDLMPPDSPLHANVERMLHDCEGRVVLEGRLPRILDGSEKPVDAEEAARFGMLCRHRREFAAAARLFSQAFEAAPRLASDMLSSNRLNAAESAAMIGRVGVDDGTGFDSETRRQWRARSRQWLREDLALWTEMIATGDKHTTEEIRRRIVLMRAEPCYDGLRNPSEIEKLPADECAECAALWREFDALQFRIDQQK